MTFRSTLGRRIPADHGGGGGFCCNNWNSLLLLLMMNVLVSHPAKLHALPFTNFCQMTELLGWIRIAQDISVLASFLHVGYSPRVAGIIFWVYTTLVLCAGHYVGDGVFLLSKFRVLPVNCRLGLLMSVAATCCLPWQPLILICWRILVFLSVSYLLIIAFWMLL